LHWPFFFAFPFFSFLPFHSSLFYLSILLFFVFPFLSFLSFHSERSEEPALAPAVARSSSSLEPLCSQLSRNPYPATTYAPQPQKQPKTSVSSPHEPPKATNPLYPLANKIFQSWHLPDPHLINWRQRSKRLQAADATYSLFFISLAALQVEVQHFAEKMLHGQNVSAVEFGGAYRAPGAEG
jgi:hypothetical protein